MLPGMIEIDDLDSAGEVLIGEVPDPDGTVGNDDFGGSPLPASAESFRVDAVTELLGGLNGACIGGRIRIADGPAVFVNRGLGEYGPELALAGAGPLSLDSASPALGFRGHDRDLDAIHQDIHFRDGLFGDDGQDQLFGAVDLLTVTEGDFRPNGLGSPFDGFGGDFQTCQYLHRFAGWDEQHSAPTIASMRLTPGEDSRPAIPSSSSTGCRPFEQ